MKLFFYLKYVEGSICGLNKLSSGTWRLPLGLQIVPGLILSIGIIRFPHSPRWLVTQDREEEAFDVLQNLRHNDQNQIRNELNEIIREVAEQRENEIERYSQLFSQRFRRRTFLSIFIQIFDQCTGINSIIYYSPIIFQQARGTIDNQMERALLITALVGSVNFLATIPAVIFLDKLGRRLVLILGSIFMFISMFVIAIVMVSCGHSTNSTDPNSDPFVINVKGAPDAIIVFVFVFIIGFASSWGPTAWIYCAEIFPISMRAKATSITTATHWIVNCSIAIIIPFILNTTVPYIIFFIFGFCCIVMGISVYLFYPETKGRSLEEMDFIFTDSKSHPSIQITNS